MDSLQSHWPNLGTKNHQRLVVPTPAYIDFVFATSGLSLFHSSIQYGKNVFLKLFVHDGIAFIFQADIDYQG